MWMQVFQERYFPLCDKWFCSVHRHDEQAAKSGLLSIQEEAAEFSEVVQGVGQLLLGSPCPLFPS